MKVKIAKWPEFTSELTDEQMDELNKVGNKIFRSGIVTAFIVVAAALVIGFTAGFYSVGM